MCRSSRYLRHMEICRQIPKMKKSKMKKSTGRGNVETREVAFPFISKPCIRFGLVSGSSSGVPRELNRCAEVT